MLFGYFTLLVALSISVVAEFYSIVGLMAIFAASPIATAIMGGALGVGKVTAAVWLKLNWDRARWTYKVYLVPAIVFLMFLTSMGIFGFLSKAHSDQSLVSGDVTSKIAIYDEKIKTEKENIEANRKALKQMDDGVDQVLGRSTTETGAEKAVAMRRSQQKERARLQAEILQSQKSIQELNDARAPIAAEVRKVEAEVGPIKYIAAMIYGDNPDANLLESAVRWVIILIVAVFDPLALMLILAAQQSLRWAKDNKEIEEVKPDAWVADVGEKPTEQELAEIQEEEQVIDSASTINNLPEAPPTEEKSIFDQHPYLKQPFIHFENLKPIVANPEMPVIYSGNPADFQEPWPEGKKEELVAVMQEMFSEKAPQDPHPVGWMYAPTETKPLKKKVKPKVKKDIPDIERPGDYIIPPTVTEQEPVVNSKFPKVPETAQRNKIEAQPVPETLNTNKLKADNVERTEIKSSFGTSFPAEAIKGDMCLRVDYLPNRLFKYNGSKWIEIDKDKTDSYTYDEQYIQYLIEKLKSGEYEIDQLSATEQDLVAQKLQQQNDNT